VVPDHPPRLRSAPALVAALTALLAAAPAPPAAEAARRPAISAPSAIVIDARTGERLYARAADARRSIASTTKLMTAYITLARTRPGEVFVAPRYRGSPVESTIGLRAGEGMSVADLLRALMLPSANDAAYALAVNVGGSRSGFVRRMNAEARALALDGTHYSTPVGLDDSDNYSTAADLAQLAARLMRNRTFATIVNLPSAHLRTGSHPRTVINRNDLVARYRFVDGVKTGHTNGAGYVLVGAAHGNGARVVSVVLGTSGTTARDADSLALLRYGVAQFRRSRPVVKGRAYARAKVRYYDGREVRLVAARSVRLTVRRGRALRTRVSAPGEVQGPLPAGRRVGTVQAIYRGRVVSTVPLVTATPVAGAGLVRRATSGIGGPLVAVAFLVLLGAALLLALRLRSRRGSPRGTAANDHHRHAQRSDRQDARSAELPPRPPPPSGGAGGDGRREGRERSSRT
jgi:serine-type D-Ala-D-Ala carboxypeptidase (penicillin-binding protein 5/6)